MGARCTTLAKEFASHGTIRASWKYRWAMKNDNESSDMESATEERVTTLGTAIGMPVPAYECLQAKNAADRILDS